MSANLPDPSRWSDLPARGATAEDAIGRAFRQARDASEPSDAALARLVLRMDAPRPSKRRQLIWRMAIAAILIMATGGVVGAALHRWGRAILPDPGARAVADSTRWPANVKRPRRGVRPSEAVGEIAAESESSAPSTMPSSTPSDMPASAASAPTEAPPPPGLAPTIARVSPGAPSARGVPSTESRLLAGAFRALRSGGDAEAALRSLDAYDRRFPTGVLHDEARIARVEALMTLNRHREALSLLEGMEAQRTPLTREVRVTRGELLIESGRCAGALRDFDAVLATRADDASGGRALYGRAACHLRAGDLPTARQDLGRYLSLHPNGPFAAAARTALNASP
jgi:hypothetical protein